MPTSEEPVNSLGEFTDRVSKIRQSWRILGNRHPAGVARSRKCPPAIPRLYEKLRGNEALTTTLSAVTAAVVGVVLIWPPGSACT
jgi:hypothetical protein